MLRLAAGKSPMLRPHAEVLRQYILELFGKVPLAGLGIEPSWTLGGSEAQVIQCEQWLLFQQEFMTGWEDLVGGLPTDPFWIDNKPTFHTYSYGSNTHIKVTKTVLRRTPEDARERPPDEIPNSVADTESDDSEFEIRDGPQGAPVGYLVPYVAGVTIC